MVFEFSAFLFGDIQVKALHHLREVAEAAPVDMPGLMERLGTPEGKSRHMDQMNFQTVEIPVDYLVTFSIEHGHPIGPCRHMSISRPNGVPSPEEVWVCAVELGFTRSLSECDHVWMEDLHRRGRVRAVNVVQRVE